MDETAQQIRVRRGSLPGAPSSSSEPLGDSEELGKLRRRVVVRQKEASPQKAGESVGMDRSGGFQIQLSKERSDALDDSEAGGNMAVSHETAPGAKSPVKTARSVW